MMTASMAKPKAKQIAEAVHPGSGSAARPYTEGTMAAITELHVNGAKQRIDGDPERVLLQILREDLDLTGCKYGCGEGKCGACTVIIDGKAVRSCIQPVGECAGKQITTIESLEKDGKLHPLQDA